MLKRVFCIITLDFSGDNGRGIKTLPFRTLLNTLPSLPTPFVGFRSLWPEMYLEAWNLLYGNFQYKRVGAFWFSTLTEYPQGCRGRCNFFSKFLQFMKCSYYIPSRVFHQPDYEFEHLNRLRCTRGTCKSIFLKNQVCSIVLKMHSRGLWGIRIIMVIKVASHVLRVNKSIFVRNSN